MPDNERARIRQIMYEPSKVWLATEHCGDRWLTDQFVLYDVTGADVLQCYDETYGIEWPDGPYQLMATGAWRMGARDSVPEPDIEAFLGIMAELVWFPATPTEWSVAEHPGKAMLWNADGLPALLGESTWTAIKRHHPYCLVEHAQNDSAGTFRFSDPRVIDGEGPHPIPFCYAAGIQIPDGQEDVAFEIVRAVEAIGNREAA